MQKDLTEFYVYNSMIKFLYGYEKRRYGYGTLQEILRELSPLSEGGTSNPAIWAEWQNCINESLEKVIATEPSGEAKHRTYTKLQAFNAMVDFFIGYYKRTASDFMGGLLGALLFLPDGDTFDPAFWEDWSIAVKKILHEQGSEKQIDEILGIPVTELQAFDAMVQFFKNYFEPNPDSPNAIMFFDYLHLLPDGNGSSSSTIREQWKTCVDSSLKEKPGIRDYRIACMG